MFAVRELADSIGHKDPQVVINVINPGLAKTALTRDLTGFYKLVIETMKVLVGRTAEEASRTLVHAATTGVESHGRYFVICDVTRLEAPEN